MAGVSFKLGRSPCVGSSVSSGMGRGFCQPAWPWKTPRGEGLGSLCVAAQFQPLLRSDEPRDAPFPNPTVAHRRRSTNLPRRKRPCSFGLSGQRQELGTPPTDRDRGGNQLSQMVLQIGLAIAVNAAILWLLRNFSAWIGQRSPYALAEHCGTLRLSRRAIVLSICGMSFVVFAYIWFAVSGIVHHWPQSQAWFQLAVGVVGAAMFGFVGWSHRKLYFGHQLDVVWNRDGIAGPAYLSKRLNVLSTTREMLTWDECRYLLTGTGGYHGIQSEDGRCVYWSSQFSGWQYLEDDVRYWAPWVRRIQGH